MACLPHGWHETSTLESLWWWLYENAIVIMELSITHVVCSKHPLVQVYYPWDVFLCCLVSHVVIAMLMLRPFATQDKARQQWQILWFFSNGLFHTKTFVAAFSLVCWHHKGWANNIMILVDFATTSLQSEQPHSRETCICNSTLLSCLFVEPFAAQYLTLWWV
jgi:hypothetical protein